MKTNKPLRIDAEWLAFNFDFVELRLRSLSDLKLLWETKVSVVATDAFIPRRHLHELSIFNF